MRIQIIFVITWNFVRVTWGYLEINDETSIVICDYLVNCSKKIAARDVKYLLLVEAKHTKTIVLSKEIVHRHLKGIRSKRDINKR